VLQKIITKIIGDPNEKAIKKILPIVEQVNHHFNIFDAKKLDEFGIQEQTQVFRDRIQAGESTDDLLPEAFGLVKYACKFLVGKTWDVRGEEESWNMVPYDVQIIGGIVLHQGKITEMKTGEGKTLVCTMPAYLNALTDKGVFVITVNDYLAHRDSEWMGGLYKCLGMTTGVIYSHQPQQEKIDSYKADITYGTNNEFGFDYLRDNMATNKDQLVQKDLHYAILDEVDSILVDEARTPLIISAPAEESTDKYYKYAQLIPQLKENEHYNVDEKMRTATLTEAGITKMEKLLGLENIYTEAGFQEVHHIEQSLKASAIFKRDKDYVIQENEIIIVDDFTGRLMPGRRYSQGLHQAIEAKENVEIKRESRTLATITFQNYFRLFEKLAGMTGTAKTEEEEFYKIYGLETIVIPTNKPVVREDLPDNIYRTAKGKYIAITNTAKELHKKGQPVLIGTVSVEQSELLSSLFQKSGIIHNVLNAKQHEREAEIVANAGEEGAVTIATNMAGRGTDIKIKDSVKKLNGLHIIGTERHESRRIDNQLRGRAGRQGDPGTSQFYVSMEDDLMRIFGGDRVKTMMDVLKVPEDQPITNKFISKAIESAQKRVEGYNFDVRKHVVEYDDVMNYHREIIYKMRRRILLGANLKNEILLQFEKEAENIIFNHQLPENSYDIKEILETINAIHNRPFDPITEDQLSKTSNQEELIALVKDYLISEYQKLEDKLPDPEILRDLERQVYLRAIDTVWIEHIDTMDETRKSVALQGYGQRDPLVAYKDEAFLELQNSLNAIRRNVVNTLFKVELTPQTQQQISGDVYDTKNIATNEDQIEAQLTDGSVKKSITSNNLAPTRAPATTHTMKYPETGRNDLCPCGSQTKYKHCHGKPE